MSTFAELAPCRNRDSRLFGVERDYFDVGTVKEEVEFSPCVFPSLGLNDDACFKQCRGRHEPPVVVADSARDLLSVRFIEEDRDHC